MAILIVIVGERMARHEVEEHIPIDRDRLLNFVTDFEKEVERLDALYLHHLDGLAEQYGLWGLDVEDEAKRIVALKSVYFFKGVQRPKELKLAAFSQKRVLPAVRVEGQELPRLIPKKVVVIPKIDRKSAEVREGRWLPTSDNQYLVYWIRFDKEVLVAMIVDRDELNQSTVKYFKGWLKKPLEPLRAASAHFSITSPLGVVADEGDAETRGAAALIVPKRLHAGIWQVQAWDRTEKKFYRDPTVMIITVSLAILFLLSGCLLYQYQQRSLKLARQRVSFVNQVSHELGSPLTNMSLNLDLAIDTLGENEKAARRRLDLVAQEIGRLNRLVGNVLTFSRSDRGVLEVHNQLCFPDEVIGDLLDSWRPALARRGVELEYEPGVRAGIECDPDALTQIISNLVSNVEKYASAGGWLGIKTSLREEELVVSVVDLGLGIPEAARHRVFRSFERVENSLNEGSSGAGLGLSIARELAKKMGGDLKMIESEKGCHFELSIPACVVSDSEEKIKHGV
ncbi:MAG: sensor histidine kinase [Akkermansiaceae bacterium]